jgi:hypothetical protein
MQVERVRAPSTQAKHAASWCCSSERSLIYTPALRCTHKCVHAHACTEAACAKAAPRTTRPAPEVTTMVNGAGSDLRSLPTSDRVTVHLLLPDMYLAGVKVSTPSLLIAGPLLNRSLAASSHAMSSLTASLSPSPAEMLLAQVSL